LRRSAVEIEVEQAGELARRHALADLPAVASVVKEVGIDVERDRDAGVAEDPTDLGDVEAEVDDQMTGEGVAEVVEAKWRSPVVVDTGSVGGLL
jgi:hypothetical protein